MLSRRKVLGILEELAPIVVEAGDKYLKPRYTDPNFSFEIRGGAADYITGNGLAISRIILEKARSIFPGSYSEEDRKGRSFRGPHIVCDPDDDTLGFKHATFETTGTNVHIVDDDNLVVGGLAYCPETSTLTYATHLGEPYVFVNGERIEPVGPADYIRAVQRFDAPNPKLDMFLEWLGKRRGLRVETVENGGPAAFAATVAKYPHNVFSGTVGLGNWKEWDTGAPQVILASMNWGFTDLRGHDLTFNNYDPQHYNGVLASRLNHLGIPHSALCGYLAEFTDTYTDRLKQEGHKETDGTIMLTPHVYKEFEDSQRLREWQQVVAQVPSEHRRPYQKSNVLYVP